MFGADQPLAYTNQDDLLKALNNTDSEEKVTQWRKELKRIGTEVVNKAFDDAGVNILAVPADSGLSHLSAAAGRSCPTLERQKI